MDEKPAEKEEDPETKCARCGHTRENHDNVGCDEGDPKDETEFCDCAGWVEPE